MIYAEFTERIIGIAGLPGSGKSQLIDKIMNNGYIPFDDVNVNWQLNLAIACYVIEQAKKVVIADIMFCKESWRHKLEYEIGNKVYWIFFENNRWQCAKNCLYRYLFEEPDRPILKEFRKINTLSKVYNPGDNIITINQASKPLKAFNLTSQIKIDGSFLS